MNRLGKILVIMNRILNNKDLFVLLVKLRIINEVFIRCLLGSVELKYEGVWHCKLFLACGVIVKNKILKQELLFRNAF